MANIQIINPIIDAMALRLKNSMQELGLKTVEKHILPDQIDVDQLQKLVAKFPAAIVGYNGRTASESGTLLNTKMTFSVIVAARSLAAPGKSDPIAADLLDPIMAMFQGETLLPNVQQSWFSFRGDTLQHKDLVLTVYQMLFETDVALSFRDATSSMSP